MVALLVYHPRRCACAIVLLLPRLDPRSRLADLSHHGPFLRAVCVFVAPQGRAIGHPRRTARCGDDVIQGGGGRGEAKVA